MGLNAIFEKHPYLKQRVKRLRFALDRQRARRLHDRTAREDLAVFAAFSGKRYADNPRAISEALHAHNPAVRIVWLFHDPEAKRDLLPPYVTAAKWKSAEGNAYLARAKAIVLSDPAPASLFVGADQIYIQTWHGDRGFKKILFDSENVKEKNEDPIVENRVCSLMLAGSKRGETKLRSAFRYQGEILSAGCPRNDVLIAGDAARAAQIRSSLGLEPKERVLLYAPTLRRAAFQTNGKQSIGNVDLDAALDVLSSSGGGAWRCLVRAHSGVGGLKDVPDSARILDVTGVEDMADLLLIADVLITDYSSSAGDFILTGKPVILYQPDRAAYQKEDRSFYFDPDETPFWIAKTPEALMDRLSDLSGAAENDRLVMDYYGVTESGRAADAAAERILHQIGRRA